LKRNAQKVSLRSVTEVAGIYSRKDSEGQVNDY